MEILSYTQGYDELSDMTDYAELDFEGYEELKRRDEEAAKPPFSGSFSIKSRPATRVSCGMARIATMKVSVKKTKPQHGNHIHGSIHNKASMYMSEEEEENYDEMSEFCDWTLGEDMDWEEEQPLGIQTAHAPSLRYSIRTRGTNNNDNSQHQWIPESEDDDSFSDDGLVRMAERIEREKQENRSKKNKKIQFQNRGGESENEQEGGWPFDSVSWTQELEDMNQQQQPTGTRDHQNQNHQGYYGPPDIEEMELDEEDNQSQTTIKNKPHETKNKLFTTEENRKRYLDGIKTNKKQTNEKKSKEKKETAEQPDEIPNMPWKLLWLVGLVSGREELNLLAESMDANIGTRLIATFFIILTTIMGHLIEMPVAVMIALGSFLLHYIYLVSRPKENTEKR